MDKPSVYQKPLIAFLRAKGILDPNDVEREEILFTGADGNRFGVVETTLEFLATPWLEPTMDTLPKETQPVWIGYDASPGGVVSDVTSGMYFVSGEDEQRTGFYWANPFTLALEPFPMAVSWFSPRLNTN